MTLRLASISSRSPLGITWETKRGKTIWRVLMPRSNQHVYYSIDERNDTVVVRAIWVLSVAVARSSEPPTSLLAARVR
jgi:hypothetical protein